MAKHEYEYDPVRGSSTLPARREDVSAEVLTVEPISIRDTTFEKSGSRPLAKVVAKKLSAPIDPRREADILPTGELYMSHVYVRRRLNEAVGQMGWALRPVSGIDIKSAEGQMFREYALIINGRVVATAFGSARYFTKSKRMDFADTTEAVKSNALTRCCKDLGIASECWDRRWCDEWREKYAVHVYVKEWDREKREHVTASYWRRLDQKPFKGEYAVVDDSPNQDRWRKQWSGWIEMVKKEIAASKSVAKTLEETRAAAKAAGARMPGGTGEPEARGGESRADVSDKSEPRSSNDRKAPPVEHGKLRPEDRRFKIKKTAILKQGDTYTLYGVQMFDDTVYTTFSSSDYDLLTKHWAAGDLIEIDAERKVTNGKEHQNIVEWKIIRKGAQS